MEVRLLGFKDKVFCFKENFFGFWRCFVVVVQGVVGRLFVFSFVFLQESVDLGEIMFFFCYLFIVGRFIFTVIKCRNFKVMDIIGYLGIFLFKRFVTWFFSSLDIGVWKGVQREGGRIVSVFGVGVLVLEVNCLDSVFSFVIFWRYNVLVF